MSLEPRALRLREVCISLPALQLFRGLSAVVAPGEVLTVMGPSGSGKSSLLDFIGGHLDEAFVATGQVLIGDRPIHELPPHQRNVGVLFQDALLFPHLSVAGNLLFGLPSSVRGRIERRERVEAALREADLAGFGDRDPATLSGGQRARVALMRTLVAEPQALLLDEPFSRLDAGLRADFRRFVFDHARSRELPTVLVTHDRDDAEAAGGPVIELAARSVLEPRLQ